MNTDVYGEDGERTVELKRYRKLIVFKTYVSTKVPAHREEEREYIATIVMGWPICKSKNSVNG